MKIDRYNNNSNIQYETVTNNITDYLHLSAVVATVIVRS